MKSLTKNIRRAAALALASVTTLTMAACGSKENPDSAGQTSEWVYVPEYIELDEDVSLYSAKFAGDFLYYSYREWDESTQQSSEGIRRFSLTDKTKEDIPLDLGGGSLNQFEVGEDGSVCGLVYFWEENETTGEYRNWQELLKCDASGSQVFRTDLRDVIGEDSYISNLVVDGKGRVYLVCDESVHLFDAQGGYAGKADISGSMNWIQSAGVGKDGKVYLCGDLSNADSSGYGLVEIDFEKKAPGAVAGKFPNSNGQVLTPGLEKDFIAHDSSSVYEYDMATQTSEKLFSWLDCDINGDYVDSVTVTDDGKLLAMISDWDTGEGSLALLTRTPGSEVTQKETIVVGALQMDQELQAAAVNFNKTNDLYRISVKTYIENNTAWDENTYPDAIALFNNDITSGNAPDIIVLDDLNVKQLAAKGVFEDLTPYLEKNATLKKENYLENIVEGLTYNGTLVAIPKRFTIQTVVGSAADVGDEMGWSLDEMIAYADSHAGANLFDYSSKSSVLSYCMMYNESAFVNWDTGECSFNTPEFISLLEFVNRFPEKPDYDNDVSTPMRIQRGEVLLDNAYISDFNEVQLYNEMFAGPVTFIGYPTTDGSVGSNMFVGGAYAIAAKSTKKEAAWSFIESYLSAEEGRFSWGLPSDKEKLNAMLEEAVKVEYYTDEEGNPMLDENGEPIVIGGGGGISYGDGWSYEYHTPTREEAEQVMEVIRASKPSAFSDDEIMNIITEEAESFFKGGKSAQDTVDIIQRRVSVYVSENS